MGDEKKFLIKNLSPELEPELLKAGWAQNHNNLWFHAGGPDEIPMSHTMDIGDGKYTVGIDWGEAIAFEIKPIPSGHTCPDCMKEIMCSDSYRTLVDGRRVHSECGPAPIKFASIYSIPARWSFRIGIDSIDWFTICFYRWYFNKGDELMESWTCEWNLRRFWKINIEP